MRLASIEMQGFKSFPDKTKLSFTDGITAVVGPNGSGKSNIADAVRWVLGEQSTRTLRSTRMEDVIFSGTQSRKAVGFASVNLTIDDLGGKLEKYEDHITIGRRLYRSGESEYRLNGEVVRLRDVHELFMDTGLGRDGYSIIGQGRISEIVSAKSGERREIFEEAAGISKYRYRRTEAQRKLEQSEENLVRLRDILSELEDRVGPLKEQAEKAKEYIIIADEMKELEISLCIDSLVRIKNKKEEQENKTLIIRNDYDKLNNQSEQIELQIADAYEKMQQFAVAMDERRNAIKVLEEESSQAKSRYAVLENDIQHNTSAIDKLKTGLTNADKDIENIGKEILEATSSMESKNKELEELTISLKQGENDIRDKNLEIKEISDKLDNLTNEKNSLEKEINNIKVNQATSETILSESKERIESFRRNAEGYGDLLAEYEEDKLSLEKQIADQKTLGQSLTEEKRLISLEKAEIADKFSRFTESVNALQRKHENTKSRMELLKDMESGMEGYFGSVKFVIGQKQSGTLSGIHGAISSLISTDSKYITAIETTLGGAMQNIVVENEAAAKNAISALKRAGAGRVTFLPLTSVRGNKMNFSNLEKRNGFIGNAADLVSCDTKYRDVINQLLGRVCVVENLDIGTEIARESSYRFRIVTLDGQIINAGGSFTGGSTSKSSGVLSRRNEIESLGILIAELQAKIKESAPNEIRFKNHLQESNDKLDSLEDKLAENRETLVRMSISLEQLDKNIEQTSRNKTLAKRELDDLLTRVGNIREGDLSRSIEDNEKRLDNLAKEILEADKTRKDLFDQKGQIEISVSNIKMRELGIEKDIEISGSEVERLEKQLNNFRQTLADSNSEIERLVLLNENISIELETLTDKIKELKENIDKANQSIMNFANKRTEIEKETTELRKREREFSSSRETVSRELAKLEEQEKQLQTEYDNIISRLWDEYELTRSAAQELAKPIENAEKSARELTKLKNKIRSLGAVNLDAVEEYSEVSERYEFLSKQVKDVEESKKKLNVLINELTHEMTNLFEDNFIKINIEFSKIFVELFGGGKGELILTEPDDILESGIEISVQPPGKVIKNLSLLSGGEQSFVAIAIYFAILKVKPSPFVLLDEIEAALDDINVVKFATYLRTMCDNTQFIAITHRRGTMEEADVLYGVTMQDEGVSKLLELNIQEIESKLGMEA